MSIVYDETINVLRDSLERARIGNMDKSAAVAKLTRIAQAAKAGFTVKEPDFQSLLDKENQNSHRYGGRRLDGYVKSPDKEGEQLQLF